MSFLSDMVHGLRGLRRHPSFAFIALASLALSIGANTLIFSILDATLLKPLAYPEADRLVAIWTIPEDNPGVRTSSIAAYFAIRDNVQAFEKVGAFNGGQCGQKNIEFAQAGLAPERLYGQCFSPSLFELLGVLPERGRVFTDAEDELGNVAPVMLLGHDLWRRRFGARDDVVGETVILNEIPTTIVGVLPADFTLFRDPNAALTRPTELDFVLPLELTPNALQSRFGGSTVVARLKPGVSVQQAQDELERLFANLGSDDAAIFGRMTPQVVSLGDVAFGRYRTAVLLLQAAVVCVLLVGCANVAGLLLGRNLARRGETAMRLALGAGRGRIMRQLVAEAAPLSIAGGAIGLLLAWGGLELFAALAPGHSSQLGDVSLDLRVLLFTAAVVLVTTVAFATIPAAQALRIGLLESLREGSRGATGGAKRQRLRRALVAAQIALAVVLLVGAGLLLKSLLHVVTADLGADRAGLVTFDFHLASRDTFRSVPPSEALRGLALIEMTDKPTIVVERVLERIAQMPGVTAVAGATNPPLGGFAIPLGFAVEGSDASPLANSPGAGGGAPTATYIATAGDYFGTMNIPLRAGRLFDASDTEDRPPVVVVNETLARRFFADESPLGKRIKFTYIPNDVSREIVGVVADTAIGPLERDRAPAIYLSHRQQPKLWPAPGRGARSGMYFAVRTTEAFGTFGPALTAAVAEIDASTPVAELRPLSRTLSEQLQELRLAALIVGAFAFVAALLAATGVYGVISLAIADRAREIALRIVVGAEARQIATMVLRSMLRLVAIGLVLGLVVAALSSRLLGWALYGTAPTDPSTYVIVAVLFVVVAVVSCLLPTLKAARVDPTVALKAD